MGPAEVYAWTAWAYSNKLEFNGWGYRFPADPDLPEFSLPLRVEKFHRYAVTHKKKNPSSVDSRNPLASTKISSKELRREWYHTKRKTMKFKDFMKQCQKTRTKLGELSGPVKQALVNLYKVRPPVKPAKLVQKPTESRAQYRARMTKQHQDAVDMAEAASVETFQKVRHISNLGLEVPFRYRSEEFRRAAEILRIIGSDVGSPVAHYGLILQAKLRTLRRVHDKLENCVLNDTRQFDALNSEYDEIVRGIGDMLGVAVRPRVDGKLGIIECCPTFSKGDRVYRLSF
jgi:hypothetical protein